MGPYNLFIADPSFEPGSLESCYRELGIETTAPPRAIRRRYLRLIKIWHPDRFVTDPAGRRAAEEKVKVINQAYRRIRDAPLKPRPRGRPAPKDVDVAARPEQDRNAWSDQRARDRLALSGCLGLWACGSGATVVYLLYSHGDRALRSMLVILLLVLSVPPLLFILHVLSALNASRLAGSWWLEDRADLRTRVSRILRRR